MRFVAFKKGDVSGLAIASMDGEFLGLTAASADYPGSLDEIVRRGDFAGAAAVLEKGEQIDFDAISFLPPFSRAGKILCIGLNYAPHAQEAEMELPDYPTVFARFNTGLVANGAPMIRPKISEKFDYEGELVAVIGKSGRNIERADALDHVAGYSIFNDGSVRDYQLRTPQWTVGKNFDRTGAFGPAFVTADELAPGAAGLKLETRLNGDVMQSSNTDQLVFPVADLVSILSQAMTLEAGDLIVTGTPSGVGAARKPPVFMKAGDVCEIEIEKIGVLKNTIEDETANTRAGQFS